MDIASTPDSIQGMVVGSIPPGDQPQNSSRNEENGYANLIEEGGISFHDINVEKTELDLKRESLHKKIGFVYRNHIVDHDNVTPYEVAGAPNYPGTSNLLLIPQDAYSTVLSIKNSLKHKDYEELGDATMRLIGIPANLANAVGSGLTYLVTFGALPKTVLSFLPFAYIAGIGLCVIEGAVDTSSEDL